MIIIKATNSFEGMILPVFSQKALRGGGLRKGNKCSSFFYLPIFPSPSLSPAVSDPLRVGVRWDQVGTGGRKER